MKSLVVIYSPLCEYNGAFLGQLEEWFSNIDLEIITIPFDKPTTGRIILSECMPTKSPSVPCAT